MDSSQTPLDRLLFNLHQRKQLDEPVSLPRLGHHDHHSKGRHQVNLSNPRQSNHSSQKLEQAPIVQPPCVLTSTKSNYKKRAIDRTSQAEKDNLHLRYKLVFSPTQTRNRMKEGEFKSKMLSGKKATKHERPIHVSRALL